MSSTAVKRFLASLDSELHDPLLQEALEIVPTKRYLAFVVRPNVKKLAQLKSKQRRGWVGGANFKEILLC